MYIRHGDVLLRPSKIPKGKMKPAKEIILAEGEVTGHYHRLKGEGMSVLEKNGVMYVSITVPTPLTHEEHGLITVPAGDYERIFEQEFDYSLQSISQVKD